MTAPVNAAIDAAAMQLLDAAPMLARMGDTPDPLGAMSLVGQAMTLMVGLRSASESWQQALAQATGEEEQALTLDTSSASGMSGLLAAASAGADARAARLTPEQSLAVASSRAALSTAIANATNLAAQIDQQLAAAAR